MKKYFFAYCLILISSAIGNINWQDPFDISGEEVASQSYRLTANTKGDVAVIWTEHKLVGLIKVSVKSSLDKWETPHLLSHRHGLNPRIGIDDLGNVTAIWINQLPLGNILTSRKPKSGSWEPFPTALTDDVALNPQINVSPEGSIFVFWKDKISGQILSLTKYVEQDWLVYPQKLTHFSARGFDVAYIGKKPGAEVANETIFGNLLLSVSLDQNMDVTLPVEMSYSSAVTTAHKFDWKQYILFSHLQSDGQFVCIYKEGSLTKCLIKSKEGATEISDFFDVSNKAHIKVAFSHQGDLVAMWLGEEKGSLVYSTKSKKGLWSQPEILFPTQHFIYAHSLVYDSDRGLLVFFKDSYTNKVNLITKFIGEKWREPLFLTNGFVEDNLLVTFSPDGQLTVVWQDKASKHLFASIGNWGK